MILTAYRSPLVLTAMDAEWTEGDHPRAENGQFGSGGGGQSEERVVPKVKQKTPAGHFGVAKTEEGFLLPVHVESGRPFGGFSHLSVKSAKAAIEGLAAVEKELDEADLSGLSQGEAKSLLKLKRAMRAQFPNGAWG